MKRLVLIVLLAALGLQTAGTVDAARRRVVVRKTPRHRTVVVVHKGWPLKRRLRQVVVRPARVQVRVASAVYLTPVVWAGAVVKTPPPHDVLVWQDGETLDKKDGWTEFTLDCNTRGTRLFLQIEKGKLQGDWAEVVFANGDTRVVDLKEKTKRPGLYQLLNFRNGRKVDHVRMVARARSKQARAVLMMEK